MGAEHYLKCECGWSLHIGEKSYLYAGWEVPNAYDHVLAMEEFVNSHGAHGRLSFESGHDPRVDHSRVVEVPQAAVPFRPVPETS